MPAFLSRSVLFGAILDVNLALQTMGRTLLIFESFAYIPSEE